MTYPINANTAKITANNIRQTYKKPNAEPAKVAENQTNKSDKVKTALKYIGIAAAAGLAIYGGVKGFKYLKGKKALLDCLQ